MIIIYINEKDLEGSEIAKKKYEKLKKFLHEGDYSFSVKQEPYDEFIREIYKT